MLVYGAKRFDQYYGGKTTAYQIWQSAKKLAGYYIAGEIAGVGYTSGANSTSSNYTRPDIWSGEWTWGAVFMTRKLADEYKRAGKTDWAANLLADSNSMVQFMKKPVVPGKDGSVYDPFLCLTLLSLDFWRSRPIGRKLLVRQQALLHPLGLVR